jgi:hypothetical protein
MDLKTITEVEKLTMNKISWKLFFETPVELSRLIMREIIESPISPELYENVSDWVNFSLNEYFLYKNYDQFQLTLSSVLLGLKVAGMEENIGKLVNFIQKENLADVSVLQTCIQHMVSIMNHSDEENVSQPPSSPLRSTTFSKTGLNDDTECSTPETKKQKTTRKSKKKQSMKKTLLKTKKKVFMVHSENSRNLNLRKSRQSKISEFVRNRKSLNSRKNKKN